jgi:hypothetical protein
LSRKIGEKVCVRLWLISKFLLGGVEVAKF